MSISPLSPRIHTVTLYQGDDLANLEALAQKVNALREELEDAKKDAKDAPPLLNGETDPVAEAKARLADAEVEHDNFLAQAEPRAVKIVLRALGRKTFRQLVDSHPPREGNDDDKNAGVNEDTFVEALVPLAIASPTFSSDAEREAFLDSLTAAQFRSLYLWAYALNTVEGATPKALTGFAPSQSAPETQP